MSRIFPIIPLQITHQPFPWWIINNTLMKRKGASIIFVNSRSQVLLLLRDNLPDLPYPNMWDVPGGHVEDNETPEECIVREMSEEMNLAIEDVKIFSVIEFSDRVEYTFWKILDFNADDINLTEGQKIRWFSESETTNLELAYGFNEIIENFFREAHFKLRKFDSEKNP